MHDCDEHVYDGVSLGMCRVVKVGNPLSTAGLVISKDLYFVTLLIIYCNNTHRVFTCIYTLLCAPVCTYYLKKTKTGTALSSFN